MFAKTEGMIVAPETSHVIKTVIDEARKCKEEKTILFNCSGHGNFDLGSYDAFHQGKLKDFPLPESKIKDALKCLPKVE